MRYGRSGPSILLGNEPLTIRPELSQVKICGIEVCVGKGEDFNVKEEDKDEVACSTGEDTLLGVFVGGRVRTGGLISVASCSLTAVAVGDAGSSEQLIVERENSHNVRSVRPLLPRGFTVCIVQQFLIATLPYLRRPCHLLELNTCNMRIYFTQQTR